MSRKFTKTEEQFMKNIAKNSNKGCVVSSENEFKRLVQRGVRWVKSPKHRRKWDRSATVICIHFLEKKKQLFGTVKV